MCRPAGHRSEGVASAGAKAENQRFTLISCSRGVSIWTISVPCRMMQQMHLSLSEIFGVEDCKDLGEQTPNSAIIRQIDTLSKSN